MPREGGILGRGSLGRRAIEAGVQRALGVDLEEQEGLRRQLVEAVGDLRMVEVLNRQLGRIALGYLHRGHLRGQDDEPEERLAVARRVRDVARRDSQMLYAGRLRNAFCFGTGVVAPRAPDPEVQDVLDDFWKALPNQAELTSPIAQWRNGKDTWENANLYLVVYAGLSWLEGGAADGTPGTLDGRVLLGSLQHDQVIDVQRDPGKWNRVLWYVVREFVYEWDYARDQPKPNPTQRKVYYEAFEGMAELDEEIAAGRTNDLPVRPPRNRTRPGRVLHIAVNRGKESAFGEPEMRTNLRWASAFNDILAGQVEKAKSAQTYLMKVRAKGARSADQLHDVAMRAVGRRSPLANAELPIDVPMGSMPGMPGARPRPGSQFWENDSLEAEPFSLDSGAANAKADLDSASSAFATGTNFPGHYFFGDPGSLAGSMAVELPVLKLTEVDQKLWEEAAFRRLCDLRIELAQKAGVLSERRAPTQDELEAGVELDAEGLVERDLSYELRMPDPLRRNLPELMQLVVDTVTAFDPMGANKPMKRALVGYTLDLLDISDAPQLLERIMNADEAQPDQGAGPIDPVTGLPITPPAAPAPGTGDPTFTGPDGQQHTSANPYGARIQSQPVVEAALRELWDRISEHLEGDPEALAAVAAAGSNGGS